MLKKHNDLYFVYVGWAIIEGSLYAKIGYASDPVDRIENWAVTGTPAPIHHAFAFATGNTRQSAVDIESYIHGILKEYCVVREWFKGNLWNGQDLYYIVSGLLATILRDKFKDLIFYAFVRKLTQRFKNDEVYLYFEQEAFHQTYTWLTSGMNFDEKYTYGQWSVYYFEGWGVNTLSYKEKYGNYSAKAAILHFSLKLGIPEEDAFDFVIRSGIQALASEAQAQSLDDSDEPEMRSKKKNIVMPGVSD